MSYKNFALIFIVVFLSVWVYGANAETVTFGYEPDPIQLIETGSSYILSNSELEIEFFKDYAGYNQYRNARTNEVIIYDARVYVEYLGPADKWKVAGIPQSVTVKQINKGYQVIRHYTGIQANYDVVYTWVENRPVKYTIYITAGIPETFAAHWSLDGVISSRLDGKNIIGGTNDELFISIQDVVRSFGDEYVLVDESVSANGNKFDYTFGTWDLNFLDVVNNSHMMTIDPSVEWNTTSGWSDWSGTMVENPNNNTLELDINNDEYNGRWDENNGSSTTTWYDWNQTSGNDGTLTGGTIFNNSGGVDIDGNSGSFINLGAGTELDFVTTDTYTIIIKARNIVDGVGNHYILNRGGPSGVTGYHVAIKIGQFGLYPSGGGAWIQTTGQNYRDNIIHDYAITWDGTRTKIYVDDILEVNVTTNGSFKTAIGNTYLGAVTDGTLSLDGTIIKTIIYKNIVLTNEQINQTNDEYHKTSQYRELITAHDAGASQVWKYAYINGTNISANTSIELQIKQNDSATWESAISPMLLNVNYSIPIEYQNATFKIYHNTTYQPETDIISNVTVISGTPSAQPPQNLSNITETTQICYNWDDDVNADYWNISQRIPSIPYTDVIIVLDGIKDQEFIDRAHTWILDSPNPTGSNGDKESISWIRNSTTLSGYADGEDDDALNNDDSFKIMLDMTANNLSTDDRQFILSEGGTVTAKRWGGSAWLPQSTNAVGVVIGAGVAGSIQYEMQIPISELTNFNNGSTIKLAMERKDTSQNPDVIKYYPLNLINDTDATIWTSINLTAESEYTFLGNTTLSNYTVTGLTPFTWYKHRFSTINGSTESSYVYSNDITEQFPQYIVSGYILTELGTPISDATVWSVCTCGCVCEVTASNITGYYQGDCFYNGTYTIYASKTDYNTNSTTVVVNGVNQSNVNITLTPVYVDPILIYPIFAVLTLIACMISGYSFLYRDTENYTHIIGGAGATVLWFVLGYNTYRGIAVDTVITTSTYVAGNLTGITSGVSQEVYQYSWLASLFIIIGVITLLHTVVKAIEENKDLIEDLEGGKDSF